MKYLLLSPLVIKAIHTNLLGGQEADNFRLTLLIFVAARYLHNQLWISISRYQNARSKRQIQSKSIEFEQVDREGTWYVHF
jgi:aldehyde decarbonylase